MLSSDAVASHSGDHDMHLILKECASSAWETAESVRTISPPQFCQHCHNNSLPCASRCSDLCAPLASSEAARCGSDRAVPYLGRSGESPSLRVHRTARTWPCAPTRPRPRGSAASRRRAIPMCVTRLLQNGREPMLGCTSRPKVGRLDLSSRWHPLLRLNDKHLGTGRRLSALASSTSLLLHLPRTACRWCRPFVL